MRETIFGHPVDSLSDAVLRKVHTSAADELERRKLPFGEDNFVAGQVVAFSTRFKRCVERYLYVAVKRPDGAWQTTSSGSEDLPKRCGWQELTQWAAEHEVTELHHMNVWNTTHRRRS